MKRGGPLRQRSDKRVAEDREREKAKAAVRQRSRGRCEAWYPLEMADLNVVGCGGQMDFHEVMTRARGGSITDPDNILHVCRRHHDWLTDHPAEAVRAGLVRHSWDDPGPKLRPAPLPTPRTGLRAANVRPLPIRRPAEVQVITHPCQEPAGDTLTLRFAYPERPWTLNGERKWTPFRRAEVVREWRHAFKMLATGSPRLAWADVEVHVYLRDMRGQDTVGAVPAYKAAQDGLVDAGVVPGDEGEFVRSVRFYPPHRKTYDALELVLTGEQA